MNADRSDYGLRFADPSYIPCVEVTKPGQDIMPGGLGGWTVTETTEVAKRFYGLTASHAMSRALRWLAKQGDPR